MVATVFYSSCIYSEEIPWEISTICIMWFLPSPTPLAPGGISIAHLTLKTALPMKS